jgi:small-conductance mechanosensitive channel
LFLPSFRVQNNILNTKLIENVRRSGPTSETFKFAVSFDTSFDHIQALREKMLLFVKAESVRQLPLLLFYSPFSLKFEFG